MIIDGSEKCILSLREYLLLILLDILIIIQNQTETTYFHCGKKKYTQIICTLKEIKYGFNS